MKRLKFLSIMLSISMCVSMIMTPAVVMADDSEVPSESQKTEVKESEETKETVVQKPEETKKTAPKESVKEETEATEIAESVETEDQKPKEIDKEPDVTKDDKTDVTPAPTETDNKPEETQESNTTEGSKGEDPTVKDVPNTPEQASSSKPKMSGVSDSIKISNGILTWTLADNHWVDELRINGSAYDLDKNASSCNLKSIIDYLIKNNRLDKPDDNYYEITLIINVGTPVEDIQYLEGSLIYTSSANPDKVDTINNINYENGVLTWKEYPNEHIEHYNIYISSQFALQKYSINLFEDFYEGAECKISNLTKYIDELIESGKITKQDSYTVNIRAVESVFDSETLFSYYRYAAKGSITINYASSAKAPNTLNVKGGKTAKVKYKKLRKKKQTVSRTKLMTVSGAKGNLTYKIISVNKKKSSFKINAKTGAITLKKKLKKGTYRLEVLVTAAGNDDYKPDWSYVTFKIKVK